jgi:hypothetical protein
MRQRGTTELSWERTVDRALVHRDAIAEVLLTDIRRLDRTSFEVAAQWPRSHRVYRPDPDGRHDPMMLLETVRQTGLALSHYGFGVPFEYKAVMQDIGFRIWPEREPRAVHAATDVAITVHCEDLALRGNQLRSMTVVLAMSADGVHFATGTGSLSWLPEHTFQALRARTAGRPAMPVTMPPALTPVASRFRAAADALIVAEDRMIDHRRILVPVDHPVYFDHPLDHVPGMLLIDAAWQAAGALLPSGLVRLVGCSMECPAFTELVGDIWIYLDTVKTGQIGFRIEQDGRTTAVGNFQLASSAVN